jgi:hypothetical protein
MSSPARTFRQPDTEDALIRTQESARHDALTRSRDAARDEHTMTVAISRDSGAPRGVRLHAVPHFEDPRGALTVAELDGQLPFPVARVYLVHGVPVGSIRGKHAHRTLQQMLIGLHGSCHVLADDGEHREEYLLDSPHHGLYLPPMIWSVQYEFSPEAVLLVLASAPYNPAEYIHDYSEFQELTRS